MTLEELISFFSTKEIRDEVEDEKKEEKKENRESLQQYISLSKFQEKVQPIYDGEDPGTPTRRRSSSPIRGHQCSS